MPIFSLFSGGSGSGGGIPLPPVSIGQKVVASEIVHISWTDPDDIILDDGTIVAEWGGTILVRKAGSVPKNKRDGIIIYESNIRNEYSTDFLCDNSGLVNGETYYYKFFPYTKTGTYTDSVENEFSATPTTQVEGIENWLVTGMRTVATGSGKLGIVWTDPDAYISYTTTFYDEDISINRTIYLATWGSTTVVVKEDGYASSKDDPDAICSLKITSRNLYSTEPLIIDGLIDDTTYYISFFPETTDGGINSSTTQRVSGVAGITVIDSIPTQSEVLTYNGNSQSPTFLNYDTTALVMSGTVSAVDAGTYTATFTPLEGYCWEDGSTSSVSVSWVIGKASPNLKVSTSSVTLNGENNGIATISVYCETPIKSENANISATCSNTHITISDISTSENGWAAEITVESNDKFNVANRKLVVSIAEGKNYLSDRATVYVTVDFVLDDFSWAEISAIAAAGEANSYWSIGDEKIIHISGTVGTLEINGDYIVYILGFDHDEMHGNVNTIDFGTFKTHDENGNLKNISFVDMQYPDKELIVGGKYFNINHNRRNYGGWKACDMRYDILGSTDVAPYFTTDSTGSKRKDGAYGKDATDECATTPTPNTLMAAFPSDLRAVMVPMYVYTDNRKYDEYNLSSNVTISKDFLPLMSVFEIFGYIGINKDGIYIANQFEGDNQTQYTYFKNGNSAMKRLHTDVPPLSAFASGFYWTRSPFSSNNYSWCYVSYETDPTASIRGTPAYYGSHNSRGVAPVFRVGEWPNA